MSVCAVCLTKGDAQVAWHHTEVDQLSRHPDQPQGLAVVPQLRPVLLKDVCGGAALHKALHAVKHWEVKEGMAAGHMQAGSMTINTMDSEQKQHEYFWCSFGSVSPLCVGSVSPALCTVLAAAHVAAADMHHPWPTLARPATQSCQDSVKAACTDLWPSSRYCPDKTNNCPCRLTAAIGCG